MTRRVHSLAQCRQAIRHVHAGGKITELILEQLMQAYHDLQFLEGRVEWLRIGKQFFQNPAIDLTLRSLEVKREEIRIEPKSD